MSNKISFFRIRKYLIGLKATVKSCGKGDPCKSLFGFTICPLQRSRVEMSLEQADTMRRLRGKYEEKFQRGQDVENQDDLSWQN